MPRSRFARYALPASAAVLAAAVALFSYGVFAERPRHQGAPARTRGRRPASVHRRGDGRLARRASARVRARGAGGALRRRRGQPRPLERGAKPGQDGLHGGGGDDRARADHLRRRGRAGLPLLVHERGRASSSSPTTPSRPATTRSRTRPPRRRRRRPVSRSSPRSGAPRPGSGRKVDRRQRCRREPDEGRGHEVVERLEQRPRTARPGRRLHQGALRRRPLARRSARR